jgi:hypothetical protein
MAKFASMARPTPSRTSCPSATRRSQAIRENVETFEQTALGMRVEVGGASAGGCVIATCLCFGDALAAVSGTPSLRVETQSRARLTLPLSNAEDYVDGGQDPSKFDARVDGRAAAAGAVENRREARRSRRFHSSAI